MDEAFLITVYSGILPSAARRLLQSWKDFDICMQ